MHAQLHAYETQIRQNQVGCFLVQVSKRPATARSPDITASVLAVKIHSLYEPAIEGPPLALAVATNTRHRGFMGGVNDMPYYKMSKRDYPRRF